MRALPRSAPLPAIALFAILAAVGCDSFSLPEEFVLPYRIAEGGPLELSYEGDGVVVGPSEGIALNPSGGRPPYSYDVQESSISPKTLGWDYGSVSNNVYSSGTAIGQVMIILIDAESKTDSVIVTVLPETPTFTGVSRNGTSGNASIAWSYGNAGTIDQFVVERKADDEQEFSHVDSVTALSCGDSGLSELKSYTYRIKAVSGAFSSPWTVSEPI